MTKPKAIIFDIDGTLAIRDKGPDGRGPYDWDRVGEDLPNEPVMLVASMLAIATDFYSAARVEILFFSGRDERCREQTEMWLDHHFGSGYKLYMRPAKHNGPDDELKRDFCEAVSQFYDIAAVFDDRNRVVDMWRSNGVTCMQVCSREDGDF